MKTTDTSPCLWFKIRKLLETDMQANDIHEWLSSKAAAFISWLSAFLGIGTFMGFINTAIGVMSAIYLAIQLWNYFTHTRTKNKLELEMLRQRVGESAGLND